MAYIKYEKETEKEEIFSGKINTLQNQIKEEDIKYQIIKMMQQEGLDIDNLDGYEIRYNTDDNYTNNNLNSNSFIDFKVYHEISKEIPYEIEREELYITTIPNYILHRNEEEARNIIFEEMKNNGININEDDTFEIAYSTNDKIDEDLYYNPDSNVTVYKIVKTKVENINKDNKAKEKLERVLKELNDLEEKLNSANNDSDKIKVINEIYNFSIDKALKDVNVENTNNKEIELEQVEKAKKNTEEKEIEKTLKQLIKDYENIYEEMRELSDREKKELDSLDVMTEEELKEYEEEYSKKKEELNRKSVTIKRLISENQKQIEELRCIKEDINSDSFKAASLGLTAEDYKEITDTLQKKKIVNAILETKGLSNITEKRYKDRTPEEKALIKEAKEEIVKEIAKIKSEENISVLEAIDALYDIEVEMSKEDHPRVLKVASKEYEVISFGAKALPEKIVDTSKDERIKTYIPGETPKDLQDEIEIDPIAVKRILFQGEMADNEDIAAVVQKGFGKDIRLDIQLGNFDIEYTDLGNGRKHYEIIEKNPNNNNPSIDDNEEELAIIPLTVKEIKKNDKGKDIITIYIDLDTNEKYVEKKVINRFFNDDIRDNKTINNIKYYKIDDDDYNFILGNTDNDFSPYTIDEKTIEYEKTLDDEEKQETIKAKQVKPTIEEIIKKITGNIEVYPKDVKKYQSDNIIVSSSFKNDLIKDDCLYNIIHVFPGVAKISTSFTKILLKQIMESTEGKKINKEIKDRIDNLTEEELEVLFNDYKDIELKNNMNFQAKNLLLEKLREYGKEKAFKNNANIKIDCKNIFKGIKKKEELDNELEDSNINPSRRETLIDERKKVIHNLAIVIRDIINKQKESNYQI